MRNRSDRLADSLHRFFSRLSPQGTAGVLGHVGLSLPEAEILGPDKRRTASIELILAAGDELRGQIEAIAGHVVALAERGEYAELALRAVCAKDSDLLDLLEEELSLEERILNVSFQQPKLLDWARNLAMTFHWKDGQRFHAGYQVENPMELIADIGSAVESIREIVQTRSGGRQVYAETFSYDQPSDDVDTYKTTSVRVHHIAIYLETPASLLMEFGHGKQAVAPVVRRAAKEMAIEYTPSTGRLDVVGRGVGGAKVFRDVAEAFRARALSNAPLTKLTYEEWPLSIFLRRRPPKFEPPEGYSSVRVTRLLLRSRREDGGKVEYTSSSTGSAYDRLRELGTYDVDGSLEWASSVTLTFTALPTSDDELAREVRAILSWPNGLRFDGATIKDMRELEGWLRGPGLRDAAPRLESGDLWSLSNWINRFLAKNTGVPRAVLIRENFALLLLAELLGIIRKVGVARDIACPVCAEEPHICRVISKENSRFEVNCIANGPVELSHDDVTLVTFDRQALLDALTSAAGGGTRNLKSFADGRLYRLAFVESVGAHSGWTLGYADGLEDENVLAGLISALAEQFKQGPGLIVTPTVIPMSLPLPSNYRFARLHELFRGSKTEFSLDHGVADLRLGRRKKNPGQAGRPSEKEVSRRIWQKESRKEGWPEKRADQAERIRARWPTDMEEKPAAGTLANHIREFERDASDGSAGPTT